MPSLRPTISALRAISALFLYRLLQPVIFMGTILLFASFVSTALLALTFSAWWWLLLVIVLPVSLVFGIFGYVSWFVVQKLLPWRLAKEERERLGYFIDKLRDVADQGKLPYPVMLVLIAKDVLRGKESQLLRSLIGDSKALTREFGEIQALFKEE